MKGYRKEHMENNTEEITEAYTERHGGIYMDGHRDQHKKIPSDSFEGT